MTVPGALEISVEELPSIIMLASLEGTGDYWLEPAIARALELSPEDTSALITRHEPELLAAGGPFNRGDIASLYADRAFNAGHVVALLLLGDGAVSRSLRMVAMFSLTATRPADLEDMLRAATKAHSGTP